jgi:hypothetical protein
MSDFYLYSDSDFIAIHNVEQLLEESTIYEEMGYQVNWTNYYKDLIVSDDGVKVASWSLVQVAQVTQSDIGSITKRNVTEP